MTNQGKTSLPRSRAQIRLLPTVAVSGSKSAPTSNSSAPATTVCNGTAPTRPQGAEPGSGRAEGSARSRRSPVMRHRQASSPPQTGSELSHPVLSLRQWRQEIWAIQWLSREECGGIAFKASTARHPAHGNRYANRIHRIPRSSSRSAYAAPALQPGVVDDPARFGPTGRRGGHRAQEGLSKWPAGPTCQ